MIETDEHILFFTAGNPEVHRILRSFGVPEERIFAEVDKLLRISCLLADVVLQSSSNYYESSITRKVTKDNLPLFHEGVARFVVSQDYGDFHTDREAARGRYPQKPDYEGYFGGEGDIRLTELKQLGFIYLRSGRMAGTIDQLWLGGLTQTLHDENILRRVESEEGLNTAEKDKLIKTLTALPGVRGTSPFIWDIVEKGIQGVGFSIPLGLTREFRLYLLRSYLRAASSLYSSATVILNPSNYLGDVLRERDAIDRYSPQLFTSLCETLGIRSIIERLKPNEILNVRNLLEFVPFRKAYFRVVDEARSVEQAKIGLMRQIQGEKLHIGFFKQLSFEELVSSAETVISRPLILDDRASSPMGFIANQIANPDRIPFILMKDAILNRYSDRLDEVINNYGNNGAPIKRQNSSKINLEVTMGDKYEVGQAGVVGPHGHAHDMTFNQIWQKSADKIDLPELASQLATLRNALHPIASSAEEIAEVGNIASAEQQAKNGNGPKVLEFLAKTGKWSLNIAEKIGVALVAAAIKTALNI